MNKFLFKFYLRTNRLKKISAQKFKNLTREQIDTIMRGNYIDQLSNEQLATINLDELVRAYDSGDKEQVGLMKALLKLNRQDIIEREYYLYNRIYTCDEIGLEEKWKLFSENDVKRKGTTPSNRESAIVSMSRNNENELIERLKEDENFANSFFKEVATSSALICFPEGVRNLICSDKKFQDEFVNSKFLCKGFNGKLFKIFENLPEDKKHLLAFYDYEFSDNKVTEEAKLVELFQKRYDGTLDKTEIKELISLRENYDRRPEASALENQRNKEYELVSNILKELSNNPDYYKEIKTISEKFCDGDIKKAAFFSQRYKNEEIRQEMISTSNQLSQEELQKLDYIVSSKKKIGIKNIGDLSAYSLDELTNLPTIGDKTEVAYQGIKGTPDNNEDRSIFNYNREIVLIDFDGNVKSKEAPINHYGTLKNMLKDSKIDISNCESAFEVGIQLAKQEKTICITTENSSAIIYFPKKLSEGQKNQYLELMEGIENIDTLTIDGIILDENSSITIGKENVSPSKMYSEEFINENFDVEVKNRNGMNSMAKECISEYAISNAEMQRFETHRGNELSKAVNSKETIMEGNGEDGR